MPASVQDAKVHAEMQLLFFYELTQIVHDRGLYALVRALVTCATSSSNSTVASRYRGHMAGSARNGPSQIG
jgi:hypothetical protein